MCWTLLSAAWISGRSLSQVGLGAATATAYAFNTGLHTRTAYSVPIDRLYVEPALELDANYVGVNGYTETGVAPFDLKVNTVESLVFGATPGVRIGSRLTLGPTTAANVYAGAGVSFLHGNTFDVDARFAVAPTNAGGFRSTFKNDSVVGRFTAGIDFQMADAVDLRVQYQGRLSTNQTEHGGQARLVLRF